MRYRFLAGMIERAWETQRKISTKTYFKKELSHLSHQDLKNLVSFWFSCFGIKAVADDVEAAVGSILKGKSHTISDLAVSSELLAKFLTCVTLSEYRIGDLTLHPTEMRTRELKALCRKVGLSQESVLRIDTWWQQSVRPKVFR